MGTKRMARIPGFGIDRVAAAAGEDPEVLRLENLDTDLLTPEDALRATREAVGRDDANSWLPFTGKAGLRRAVARQVEERSGVAFDPETQVVITCGEGDAMVDALFVVTDPGDEVILTRSDLRGDDQSRPHRGRRAPSGPAPQRARRMAAGYRRSRSGRRRPNPGDLRGEPGDADRKPLERGGVGSHRLDLPRAERVVGLSGVDGTDPFRPEALPPSGLPAGNGQPGPPRGLRHNGAADDRLEDRMDRLSG